MARILPERMTARIEGDFVAFFIGMRINKPWKLHKWLPTFVVLPRMAASRDVGIWHETYQVRAGEYEAIYSAMPPIGLDRFANLLSLSGHRESARGRVSQPTA